MKDIIVIVGPTGVGKTKLSIELAKKLDAEIINGDSVAIYKKLDIGSAKPTKEEMENIPHHLIDICEVDEYYSVFEYQKDVRKLIEEINKKNKRIIIVGGTGLYVKAALYDYDFTEGTTYNNYDDLSNEEILLKIKEYSNEELPHINNRKRLIRLLNKYENNEKVTHNKDKLLYPIKVIGLTTDRTYLYERINKRVDVMFEEGLLEEAERLYKKGYKNFSNIIGYRELNEYFINNISLEKAKELIKQNSRHYAKRQFTWFYNQMKDIKWFDVNYENFNETIDTIKEYLN